MTACKIEWKNFTADEWDQLLKTVQRANLLQSHHYARVLCKIYHQTVRRGIIYIDDQKAGIVQFQEASILKNMLHGLMFDRGPLWLEGFGKPEHIKAFFDEFYRQFPKRFGRWRRILPEIQDHPGMRAFFAEKDVKCISQPGYQTVWLDINKPDEQLRSELKQKWRNMLNKSEKQGLTLEWDDKGLLLPWMLTKYKADQDNKVYEGPNLKVLTALGAAFSENGQMIIGRAVNKDKEAIAGILIFCHGLGATYQVGWSSDEGRDKAAHNLLLWNVILKLKDKGIKYFDLGGVNDGSAKGIKKFKEGLGGETVTYLGHYV